MGNCHPLKTNVDLGFATVDIAFLRVTTSHVTLSCSLYLYNATLYFQRNDLRVEQVFALSAGQGEKNIIYHMGISEIRIYNLVISYLMQLMLHDCIYQFISHV